MEKVWYEMFRNGLMDIGFVVSKVDPCLFMANTVICVLYVDYFLFCEYSQSDIDNVMNYSNEDGPSSNWEHSKVESASYLLGIDINTLDDGGFQFYQTRLIPKVLENTGMFYCGGFLTPTNVGAPLGADENGIKYKRNGPNSYASVIGMILYLSSNKRPHTSFVVCQCDIFTNNIKESRETDLNRIYWYLQGNKYKCLVFNISKKNSGGLLC